MKRAWHQRAKRLPREDRTSDDIVFDSRAEMLRWQELQMLERAGVIVNLQRQLIMPLVIGGQQVRIRSGRYKNGRACIYTADFSYIENGQRIVEEYKAFDDPTSKLRRAIVEAIYGLEIRVTGPASLERYPNEAAAKHTPPAPQEAPTEPTRTRIGRRVFVVTIRVEHADMLEAIPRLVAEGVVVDAVVTDPPYHLLPTIKRFGEKNAAPAQRGRDGAMARLSGGFMGQQWDGGDIAFRPETWATVASIMRPGAFLVAFGGTRTHHRVWCAIEDAGFVIQDTIMWLFGSGFPKRRDALKPAFEPVCLAYKPGGKRTMQVDECRVAAGDSPMRWEAPRGGFWATDANASAALIANDKGRWPANCCHDGSDEVLAAFPESKSRGGTVTRQSDYEGLQGGSSFAQKSGNQWIVPADRGSAARFFFSAKAGAEDRWGSRHPTVKPVDLIAWLVKLVCPPGGTFLDPFAGSGTAAVAALKTGRNAVLIEREDLYVADIRERIAFYEGGGKHSIVAKNRNRGNGVGALRDGNRGRPVANDGPLFAPPTTSIEDNL